MPRPLPPKNEQARYSDQRELALAALRGEPVAVARLARNMRIIPRILRVLNRRFASPFNDQDIEDLSQDIVVLAWQRLDRFQGQVPFDSWICKFCEFTLRNRLRRDRIRKTSALDKVPEEALPQTVPEDFNEEAFERLLEKLPEPEAQVIRPRCTEGVSFKEIGKRLGLPSNTVKTRYHRGIQRLRTRLVVHGKEEAP